MNIKIVIILIIFVSVTTANAPTCYFVKKMFFGIFYEYGCEINTNNEELKVLNEIYGMHDDKSDRDVKLLTIDLESSEYFEIFPSIFCEKFENLKIIDMSGANISEVIMDAFNKCRNLQFLKFCKNKISQIYENIFNNNENLRNISLSQNKFVSLPKGLFKKQEKLIFLDLSGNSLDDLPHGIFQSQVKLKELKLDSNKIGIMNQNWFENLRGLQDLDLSGNKIEELPENIFKNLESLKTLKMNSNLIVMINSNSFGQHARISTVSLDLNPIFAIDENFIINNAIEYLYLEEIECGKGAVFANKETMIVNLKECFDNFKMEQENSFFLYGPLDLISTPIPIKPTKIKGTIPLTTLKANQALTITAEQTTSSTTRLVTSTITESSTSTTLISHIQEKCGITSTGTPLVVHGDDFDPGTYPWMAVLADNNKEVHCGGVLISSRKVLTAGHCIITKSTIKYTENDLVVVLGSHNLNYSYEVARVVADIDKIHVHDNWNPATRKFEFDIALIILKENIEFKSNIFPICLTRSGSPALSVTIGTVIGYGNTEDESKKYSIIPKRAQTPIHRLEPCLRKYPELHPISANTTFCGGHANGTGACTGDSGGGLFVVYDNVYYLRGIVSSSLSDHKLGCNVNTYALYTNVTKFIKWIEDINVSNVTSRGKFIKSWSPKPKLHLSEEDKPIW